MNTNTLTIADVISTTKLDKIKVDFEKAKSELLFLSNKENEYFSEIKADLINKINLSFNEFISNKSGHSDLEKYSLLLKVSEMYIQLELSSKSEENSSNYTLKIYKEEDWGDFSKPSPKIYYEVHYPAIKIVVGESSPKNDNYLKLADFVNQHTIELVDYFKEYHFKLKNSSFKNAIKIAKNNFETQTKLLEQEQNDIVDNTVSCYREQDKVTLQNVSILERYPEPHLLECNGFTFDAGPFKIPAMSFFIINKRNKKTVNVSFFWSNYDGTEISNLEVSLTNEIYDSLLRSAAVWNIIRHLNISQQAINEYNELIQK